LLRRNKLSYELRVAENPAKMAAAIERFLKLHTARAVAPFTPRHPDVFASASCKHFVQEYILRAAATGEAKLFELYVGGHVAASRVGFVLEDDLYLYYSGYDPSMSKYSVMRTCTAEAIRWAIKKRIKRVNLSLGQDRSKTRWRPIEVPFWEAQLVNGSKRSLALFEVGKAIGHWGRWFAAGPSPLPQLMRTFARREE